MPASRETWIERYRPIGQRNHAAQVLAEKGQRVSNIDQNPEAVAGHLKRSIPGVV